MPRHGQAPGTNSTAEASLATPVTGATLSPASGPQWVSIGPTAANHEIGITLPVTDSGRLRTILPDPYDPNTVYVLSSGGGLWKTNNFLSSPPTWTPLTDELPTTSGGAATFGSDSGTIYLGLGDPFDTAMLVGGAVVKSTDGGTTWSAPVKLATGVATFTSPIGDASAVRDIKVDAQVPGVVLVATDVGLFRSSDAGSTFQAIAPNSGELFHEVQFWSLVQTSAGWVASGIDSTTGYGKLFMSADHGMSWQLALAPTDAGRMTLAVGLPGDNVVYAYASNAGGYAQLDLFRSADGGQTWTPLGVNSSISPTNPNGEQFDMDLMHQQAWYNQMVLVDPTDPARNTVYLGGSLCSAKTTDGGTTWTLISDWLPSPLFGTGGLPYVHADFHAAAFSNFGGASTVFFGNDGGLFVSTDGGAHWDSKKNTGLVTDLHYSLTSNPTAPASTITGLQDLGTRVREGDSSIFDETLGGDGMGVATSQANAAVTLGSYQYGNIFASFDLGLQWEWANSGIVDPWFYTNLLAPEASADSTGLVFFGLGLQTIYETSDGGLFSQAWRPIGAAGSGGIPAGTYFFAGVHAIGVGPKDTNHVAVAAGPRLYLTADRGNDWSVFTPASYLGAFNSSLVSPVWADNNTLYVALDSLVANAARVARSTDGGVTWSAAGGGLPDVPVNRLLVDHRDPTGATLFAGTFIGVYRTTDGGQSWSLFGSGLPAVNVTDLYEPPDGSFLRIATYGRGIWEAGLTPPTTTLQMNAPSSAQAGTSFSVSVTALDGAGNVTPAYAGTVHFSSSDSMAALPADYTFSTVDQGVHTFSGILRSAGIQSITAADLSLPSLTSTANVTVRPADPSYLQLTTPSTTNILTLFPLNVRVVDAFGNTVDWYRGTVHFGSSVPDLFVPLDYQFTASDGGAHTFSIRAVVPGSLTLTANDTAMPGVKGSATLTVVPGRP